MTNMPSSLTLAAASRIGSAAPSVQGDTPATTQVPQKAPVAAQPAVPVKDRLENLLADQVKSGSLTDDQASELKSLFAEAAAPQPATSVPAEADSDTAIDPRQSGGGLNTLSNKLDRMSALLDKMRANMAQGAGYSAGATPPAASAGMVFNGIA